MNRKGLITVSFLAVLVLCSCAMTEKSKEALSDEKMDAISASGDTVKEPAGPEPAVPAVDARQIEMLTSPQPSVQQIQKPAASPLTNPVPFFNQTNIIQQSR